MVLDFPGQREGALLEDDGRLADISERLGAPVIDAGVPLEALLELRARPLRRRGAGPPRPKLGLGLADAVGKGLLLARIALDAGHDPATLRDEALEDAREEKGQPLVLV